jgi:hypothetical protein
MDHFDLGTNPTNKDMQEKKLKTRGLVTQAYL